MGGADPLSVRKSSSTVPYVAAQDTLDYKKVKQAFLPNLRSLKRLIDSKSPKEFYNKLKDLYRKWMQPEKKIKQQVGETIILEQSDYRIIKYG